MGATSVSARLAMSNPQKTFSNVLMMMSVRIEEMVAVITSVYNFEGGFNCSCDDGFNLSDNGRDCIDINECELGLDDCHPNATCSDVDGGYECFCNIGFEGNGTSCINTDECAQSGSPCQENAECTDIEGGFVCQCLPGFEELESTCINVNECESGHNCHPNATCTDTEGSYICNCNEGNAGDGFTCEAQCAGRGIFDYTSDIDTKTSTTFEPGNISRTPSVPLVHMADVRRHSGRSSRSGSFSSIDPSELTYTNMSDRNKQEKFDDPVYEHIKGGEKEEFAPNPLYDGMKNTNL